MAFPDRGCTVTVPMNDLPDAARELCAAYIGRLRAIPALSLYGVYVHGAVTFPGPWPVGTWEDVAQGPDGLELPIQAEIPAAEADDDPDAYDGFFEADAREDGVPDCAIEHPVLVFSHGNSGIRFQSVFWTGKDYSAKAP